MAVTIHVNGRSNSLAHKGCMGITKSTLPDVCKTPSPGGPIPIPYPIIVSLSSSLKKGTKTVKVDGKNSAAIKGSEYSRCNGDEPGTVGGVKSSTNMKEATWILYSFDVKLDGKNACRLSDKMMMNHGNTACLGGELQIPVAVETARAEVLCKIRECDMQSYSLDSTDQAEKCLELGRKKHKCLSDDFENREQDGILSEASFDMNNHLPASTNTPWMGGAQLGRSVILSNVRAGRASRGWGPYSQIRSAAGQYTQYDIRRPDIVLGGDPIQVIDAKFPCPNPTPSSGVMPSEPVSGTGMWRSGQEEAYRDIAGGNDPEAVSPKDVQDQIDNGDLTCP